MTTLGLVLLLILSAYWLGFRDGMHSRPPVWRGTYDSGEHDDRVEDYGAEITRTSHLVSELSLKHGITVSRVFASFKDWQEAKTAFVRSVREEGVAA